MSTRHTTDADAETESDETINGLEARENRGSAFDPENKRLFSILPDCDADEAYCVRHDRDMVAVDTVFHSEGALYATADDWGIYSCQHCQREAGEAGEKFFKAHVTWAFDTYNDTDEEALDGAFQYVGEADEVGGDAE